MRSRSSIWLPTFRASGLPPAGARVASPSIAATAPTCASVSRSGATINTIQANRVRLRLRIEPPAGLTRTGVLGCALSVRGVRSWTTRAPAPVPTDAKRGEKPTLALRLRPSVRPTNQLVQQRSVHHSTDVGAGNVPELLRLLGGQRKNLRQRPECRLETRKSILEDWRRQTLAGQLGEGIIGSAGKPIRRFDPLTRQFRVGAQEGACVVSPGFEKWLGGHQQSTVEHPVRPKVPLVDQNVAASFPHQPRSPRFGNPRRFEFSSEKKAQDVGIGQRNDRDISF